MTSDAAAGQATAITDGVVVTTFPSVPAGSRSIGENYYLSGGDLYFEDAQIDSGVTSAAGYRRGASAGAAVYYVKGDQSFYREGSGAPQTLLSSGAAGGVVVGGRFLLVDGSLFFGADLLGTGVTSASGFPGFVPREFVDFIDGDGAHTVGPEENPVYRADYPAVPRTATALAAGYFLDGGDLWYNNTFVSSGVSSAVAHNSADGGADAVTYVKNGIASYEERLYQVQTVNLTYPGVPSGATALAARYWLDGSTLYFRENVVLTDVASADGFVSGGTPGELASVFRITDSCTF